MGNSEAEQQVERDSLLGRPSRGVMAVADLFVVEQKCRGDVAGNQARPVGHPGNEPFLDGRALMVRFEPI